ncbi:M15 family metallopeptidase [Herbiconiux sp. A18JL235]|uniref:M15 family metallopeptidase n=1 Tax=Herbiconiux sp. A18JL235 TaxID=3152363 RepID=A0AB39BBZ6_9MICO
MFPLHLRSSSRSGRAGRSGRAASRPPLVAVAFGAALLLASCSGTVTAGPGAAPAPSVEAQPGLGDDDGGLGADDGVVPFGESVSLRDDVAAMTGLTPELRDALERAEAAAVADRGLRFTFVDGWRSVGYQEELFERAVQKYGSEAEAARWVKRGDDSKHVTGEAVDLETADAMDWLNRFGDEFGLCQVYTNELWHFELTADDAGECPPQLRDGSAG